MSDICVVPDSDMIAFNNAEKEIFNIIKKNFILTKKANFKKIQSYLQVAINICTINANNSSLLQKYSNLSDAIKKEFGSIPNVNPPSSGTPINTLISNYIQIVSDYNSIIKNINNFSDEEKEMIVKNTEIKQTMSMLLAGIRGIETLCSSKQSTWDRRLSNTKNLLSMSKTALKETDKYKLKLDALIKEKVVFEKNENDEKVEKISPQDIATHKKLLSQFGNNSVEYRKWWIWYNFSGSPNTPRDIKNQLIDFNHKSPSSISLKNVKKIISSLSYASIQYLIDNIPDPKKIVNFSLYYDIYKADPYLAKSIDNDFNAESQAFKISIQSLAKDLKKELEKRLVLMNSEIGNIKPTSDVIDNILSILKKCLNDIKTPFPNNLHTSLKHYVGGGGGVSSNNMNAVLRNTLNILEKDGFGKFFDPKIYAKLCHHIRTIANAFKEDDNSDGPISKTLNDQTVVRGMDYIGLCAMFKNGGYEIPTDRNQFNETIINDINNKKPIFFDKAFLSTAMSNTVGDSFARGQVCLKIFVPKGTKSVNVPRDVRGTRFSLSEKELILPPKTRLKVKKCAVTRDNWIVIDANVVN